MMDPVVPVTLELPQLPLSDVKEFIPYFSRQPDEAITEVLEPFKNYENELRKIYAQQPEHHAVNGGKNPNLVPVFAGHEGKLKIRARDLASETEEEKAKYLMQLKDSDRKKAGEPALVSSFKDFQTNFNIFSESSLSELKWDNVVVAGSSVTTALLPVPEEWAGSKKSIRAWYHEKLAPASDVDLFLYGLTEEQAIEKIKEIERSIKDALLHETTTIRTKNAITIASQYPTRHVQIVLRLYDSISQIISGFDIDCACAAYDGRQVHMSPRALVAFATQCNTIDLTRRSPSYENRLSKYSHRGFEVHWPLLDRSRIDPTIFERSFNRTMGLARLLVLEKLPKTTDRDQYIDRRREERGRPSANRSFRNQRRIWGNIKEMEEDDIPDWQMDDQVSDYHTFVTPYGAKFNAAKINRLLYSKDLLLNAEWNKPKDRVVHLHRHPCFFGDAADVIEDCCGFCPVPTTDEEIEAAEEEEKIYIKGRIRFITDDPGRQEIGSFNPITTGEWTEMAYVGNTQLLMQAIIDSDMNYIEAWCMQEGNDINTRDYVGRTPLHLAIISSTLEVVQLLVENGARMVARLIDGRTSLHIASQLGRADVVDVLMKRSLQNAEEEDEKQEAKRMARKVAAGTANKDGDESLSDSDESIETLDNDSDASDDDRMTQGSFVKIQAEREKPTEALEESEDEPDVFDIDVVAWDAGATPLHFAIIGGHVEVIKLLAEEYGADVFLPIKIANYQNSSQNQAILSLVISMMALPDEKARVVLKLLLELGASSAQADMKQKTALQYYIAQNSSLLDILFDVDGPAARGTLNHICFGQHGNNAENAVAIATKKGYEDLVKKLLSLGAKPQISFEEWIPGYLRSNEFAKHSTTEQNNSRYRLQVIQPVITAATFEQPVILKMLLEAGADPSTVDVNGYQKLEQRYSNWIHGNSILDLVRAKLKDLRSYSGEKINTEVIAEGTEAHYMKGLKEGSYKYFVNLHSLQENKNEVMAAKRRNEKEISRVKEMKGIKEKKTAILRMISEYEAAEKVIVDAGGKTFKELYPEMSEPDPPTNYNLPQSPASNILLYTKFGVDSPNINQQRLEGYDRLFEAVWDNDVETVKSLTLSKWKTESGFEMDPLNIAVQQCSFVDDSNRYKHGLGASKINNFSPFSAAVLRGHMRLASVVLDICQAQYQPDDEPMFQKRWMINAAGSDSGNDSDDDDGPQIYSELISDTFTINDITAVSGLVKSSVKPLGMMSWSCKCHWFLDESDDTATTRKTTDLLTYSLQKNDVNLMRYLLKAGEEQTALFATNDNDPKFYRIPISPFRYAIKTGKTAMLSELIKSTGVGIPFDTLVQQSGVVVKETPTFYQGLSIAGKKRTDWAQAGRPYEYSPSFAGSMTPLLLEAAHEGSIESVEWFLSDTPARSYQEFKEAYADDKRIKILEQAKGGFESIINNWLGARGLLALHSAIAWNPAQKDMKKYMKLIQYLLDVMPEALNHKSINGYAPLSVAVAAYSFPEVLKLLIDAGADQRVKDKLGNNLLHYLAVPPRSATPVSDAKKLKAMLAPFNVDQIKEMRLERNHAINSISSTPLASWVEKNGGDVEVLEVLLSYGNGEELEMINSAGDFPLHTAIKKGSEAVINYLITANSSLLFRENAVGITPVELARDLWLQELVKPSSGNEYWDQQYNNHIIARAPSTFDSSSPPAKDGTLRKRVYDTCRDAAEEHPSKRRLVSLFEANEVAKRLASQQAGRNAVVKEEEKTDELTGWLGGDNSRTFTGFCHSCRTFH